MPDVSITDTFLLHFWRKQEVLCRMLLPMDGKKAGNTPGLFLMLFGFMDFISDMLDP